MGDSKHDSYDWLKLMLDNKGLIIAFISFLISAGANVSQAFDVQKKNADLKMIGESYAELIYHPQKIVQSTTPKQAVTKTIYINNCSAECEKIVQKHIDALIEEYHR